MFDVLANNAKAAELESDSNIVGTQENSTNSNSILDELKLAQKHLVFKMDLCRS
jgi:hypothetical protein